MSSLHRGMEGFLFLDHPTKTDGLITISSLFEGRSKTRALPPTP